MHEATVHERGGAAVSWVNPILIKGLRSRLRTKHVLSWGLITLTVTAFVCMMVYLPAVERSIADKREAARWMLIAVLIIQAILLMLLGTGAVASGLANERDQGLLDYHRMTPMSPTRKIVGFLFGLSAREYTLVAMTLPFVAFAVIVGQVRLTTLAHFYVVFISSVWLYHMTGMVAGMVSPRPRRAAMLAQGLVLLLYLVLPNLSFVGLTFIDHLTIRPTIFRIIQDDLQLTNLTGAEVGNPLGVGRSVPFFNWELHPSVFTLIVQGSLLWLMFTIVHRKWTDETAHGLSKVRGLATVVVTSVLALGSLWPVIMRPSVTSDFFGQLFGTNDRAAEAGLLASMAFAVVLIVGAVALLVVHTITPSGYMTVKALRRSHKLSLPGIPMNSDGASSLPVTVVAAAVPAALAAAFAVLLLRSGRVFEGWPPVAAMVSPLVLIVSIVLFFQAMRQRLGGLATVVVMFMVWMVPVFIGAILMAAWGYYTEACYVALPMPPVAIGFAALNFFDNVAGAPWPTPLLPEPVGSHVPALTATATIGYLAAAVVAQVWSGRWRSSMLAAASRAGSQASRLPVR